MFILKSSIYTKCIFFELNFYSELSYKKHTYILLNLYFYHTFTITSRAKALPDSLSLSLVQPKYRLRYQRTSEQRKHNSNLCIPIWLRISSVSIKIYIRISKISLWVTRVIIIINILIINIYYKDLFKKYLLNGYNSLIRAWKTSMFFFI